ncbi:MAG: phage holin family protein [Paludibacter sp.]|nr:phage holin family protein [Bacteroidales bacterium]MCM1069561.1 phage holin family protein [Prevotella sp.]MCM1354207.1 phage holin family protein [Bacteroides sp.]MCM1443054.1 phage holin family protein [Muribaculum sp.]MCM1482281.1 phage holin family protein [Paludibacter sp.]
MMEPKPNQYQQLLNDSKAYLKTGYDLLRLELLDKLSLILGIIIALIVALFLGFAAIAYFSVALVGWMTTCMPTWVACCILGGFFLAILIVLWCCRQRIFINPFIKLLSGILFKEPEQEKEVNHEVNASDK